MTRKIYIECGIVADEHLSVGYSKPLIRSAATTITFIATLYVEGSKAMVKTFSSHFKDCDMDDEERLAEMVILNLYTRSPVGIYDVRNPPEEVGDELIIEFSPHAKEWFEFLGEHKQRLLDSFSR